MSRIKPHQHLSVAVRCWWGLIRDLPWLNVGTRHQRSITLRGSSDLSEWQTVRKRLTAKHCTRSARTKTTMPMAKMTLKPLRVAQEETFVMSNKDIRDIFYAAMDGIQGISKKQDRVENCVQSIDARVRFLHAS
ncbi:unnamed protein product [Nippostrongylus brasiliensis]|uniref:Uncharacterized protein n=1 Tax=Nippostrongylus brasiliensis TaxID=27835 RepID=A0A0N4Y7N4_NIPBR|nr:unnamed protein product [Nippostrongylus brasiliensis]